MDVEFKNIRELNIEPIGNELYHISFKAFIIEKGLLKHSYNALIDCPICQPDINFNNNERIINFNALTDINTGQSVILTKIK